MLRLIWTHYRDINVKLAERTIRYSIPIYSEEGLIGRLLKAKQEDGTLNITFERNEPEVDATREPRSPGGIVGRTPDPVRDSK
jgi:hypothetical protein